MSLRNRASHVCLILVSAIAFAAFGVESLTPDAATAQKKPPAAPAQQTRPRRMNPSLSAPPQPTPTPGAARQADETDDDVVRVETDLTNILLTAVDKNRRFVTTLKREDVRLFENNVAQDISVFERETGLPLSLAILIDTSRSQERTLPEEKAAANGFVNAVVRPDRDNVAVVTFTGEPTSEQPLTNDKARLRSAFERIKVELPPDNPECEEDVGSVPVELDTRCWTAIWDAVWVTVDEVLAHTSEQTRRAIILLSDGDDTGSRTKRQEAIDYAVKNNVTVYGIAIGDREHYDVDEGALRKVSEQTGGRAFFPRDKAELSAAFAQIEQELRSQYLVAYSSSNKNRDGSFRRVKIEVVNPELRKEKLRLLYREGYYARSR